MKKYPKRGAPSVTNLPLGWYAKFPVSKIKWKNILYRMRQKILHHVTKNKTLLFFEPFGERLACCP
jgi:hypothetical protein